MTARQMFRYRHHARFAGITLIVGLWLMLTGALGEIVMPAWATGMVGAIGTGLVVWGSTKTRIEKLEQKAAELNAAIGERITREVFTQHVHAHVERLDRIEKGNDRLQSTLDRLMERDHG